MRTFNPCACLLIAGTLLMLAGCKKTGFKSQDHGVDITNCAATPDEVKVHEGDRVRWNSGDQRDYAVSFSDANEPTANPIKVKHGASDSWHPIKGHNGCTLVSPGEFYCKYNLTRDNDSSPCKDPGLRVVP